MIGWMILSFVGGFLFGIIVMGMTISIKRWDENGKS